MLAIMLPKPDPLSQSHSDRLALYIRSKIEQGGPLSFQQFMQDALYAPGLGYYIAGNTKLGADGDFVTAPEISPLFSQCLANQCAQVLSLTGGDIVELGAGRGVMARDILRELQHQNHLPDHYFILETSPDLKQRQEDLLKKEFGERVVWLDSLDDLKINGVILANEVMDAMPVNVFRLNQEIEEVYVDYQDGKFIWQFKKLNSNELMVAINQLDIKKQTPSYTSEINPHLPGWIASLADTLNNGLILLSDYGFPRHEYYHHDRHMGTLMCHFRHHAHPDPLIYPGIQDITAHVDFTAVAEAADQNDLAVSGFTNQMGFLLNCGLMSFVDPNLDATQQYEISQQIKRLTLPSEMGELFKFMALTKNMDVPLLGFQAMDQLGRL